MSEEQNQPIDPAKFFPLDRYGRYQTAIDALQENDHGSDEIPRTLLEIELCKFAGAIRDRQLWWEKLNNETIVSKWRGEVGENAEKFDYAIAECKWQAEHYKGPARPGGAEGVFAIQDVPQSLLQRLLEGIQHIRNIGRRDEHPGSDGIVVDIIHPSLYAYEQGVTPVLGDAQVYEMPDWDSFVMNKAAKPEDKLPEPKETQMCSKFGLQWLPAEFFVKRRESTDDLICEINSYINSLHPIYHSSMYRVIEEAFLQCVPLLEEVMAELGESGKPRERPLRIDDRYQWRVEADFPSDEEYEDENIAAHWARSELHLPKVPKEFEPPPIPKKVTLLDKRLQVIVKIASIELTPEKPCYSGGSWHVEGMRNERIVATACMYLESDNCTESMLEFRAACHEPEYYHQFDDPGVLAMYGLEDKKPLVQARGVCRTLAGRVLAWPNTLQHRVRPFELMDKSRNGRRTILCFFLVDPSLRIRSTATVPPQIHEWQEVAMEKLLPNMLPKDLSAKITSNLDGLSYEEACERRSRLMSERMAVREVVDYDGNKFFERAFSLCEH